MPDNQTAPRQRNESTLYYALGGGLGHVTRACALARQLARLRPGRHRVISNTTWPDAARRLFAAEPRLELVLLPSDRSVAETQDALIEATSDASFDLLVVDTFPRGLGGELARLGREFQDRLGVRRRVLVSRGLPAEYVSQWRLHEWVAQHYDLVLVPGEPSLLGDLPSALATAPFVVRNDDELLDYDSAAERLRVDDARGCVLIVGSGMASECERMWKLTRRLTATWPLDWPPLRFAAPTKFDCGKSKLFVDHAPLIECLAAVRLVIGQAGYNLAHETQATNTPALLIARPRRYDDQSQRSTVDLEIDLGLESDGRRGLEFDLARSSQAGLDSSSDSSSDSDTSSVSDPETSFESDAKSEPHSINAAVETLERRIASLLSSSPWPRAPAAYSNGAETAARRIVELCERREGTSEST